MNPTSAIQLVRTATDLSDISDRLLFKHNALTRTGSRKDSGRLLSGLKELSSAVRELYSLYKAGREPQISDLATIRDRVETAIDKAVHLKEQADRLSQEPRRGSLAWLRRKSKSDLEVVQAHLDTIVSLLRVLQDAEHQRGNFIRASAIYMRSSRHGSPEDTPFRGSINSLYNSLWDHSYSLRHHRYRSLRLPGTCTWFLNSAEFRNWNGSRDATCLWCRGIPGCGKSTTMSSVIDNYLEHRPLAYNFAYYYLAPGKVQTAGDFLDSIAQQLHRTDNQSSQTIDTLKKASSVAKDPFEQIKELLRPGSQVQILVDGWDEENMRDPKDFSDALRWLLESGCKLLVFSRYDPDGTVPIDRCHIYQINDKSIEDDLRLLVDSDLQLGNMLKEIGQDLSEEVPYKPLTPEMLKDSLISSADHRYFRCASQCRRVIQQRTLKDRKHLFLRLPKEPFAGIKAIDWTLDCVVLQQSKELNVLARRTLIWLSQAQIPMHVAGLCEALTIASAEGSVYDGELRHDDLITVDQMQQSCNQLVWIDEVTKTAAIAHYDVQIRVPIHWEASIEAQTYELGMACIRYLMLNDFAEGACQTFELFQSRLSHRPFLRYASTYWLVHFWKPHLWKSGLDCSTVLDFVSSPNHFASAVQVFLWFEQASNSSENHFQRVTEEAASFSCLELAAKMDLKKLIESTRNRSELLAPDTAKMGLHHKRTPSSKVAFDTECGRLSGELIRHLGHSTFADDLITKLILSDRTVRSAYGQTLVDYAIKKNKINMLREVFSHGFRRPKDIAAAMYNPLCVAIAVPTPNFDIIEELLETDIARMGSGKTPLQEACERGSKDVITLLLQHRAFPDAPPDSDSEPPLWWAIQKKDSELVRLLLHHGASMIRIKPRKDTALACAVRNKDEAVVRILLASGATVEDSEMPDNSTEDDGIKTLLRDYRQIQERPK